MDKSMKIFMMVLALSLFAASQTKISGTVKCAKPDQFQKIDIGDKPGHAFAISQGKCIWVKPMDIAGAQTKEDVGTNSMDMTDSGAEVDGYVVGTLTSGDKFYVQTDGKDTYNNSKPESTTGKWKFVGGSGKMDGIKGGGTYSGKADADGSFLIEVKGEYSFTKKK